MRKWIAILLICIWGVVSFAANDKVAFDVEKANSVLQATEKKLPQIKGNIAELEATVKELIDLQGVAKDCIKTYDEKIKEIKDQLKRIEGTEKETAEKEYLTNRKAELELRQSQCRLFDIQAEEIVDAYSTVIQEQVTTKLLKRDDPLWVNIARSPAVIPTIDDKFNTELFKEKSGIKLLDQTRIFIITALILIGMVIGVLIKKALRSIVKQEASEELTKQIISAFCSVLSSYLIIALPIFLVTSYLAVLSNYNDASNYLLHLGYSLSAYMLVFMAIRFIIRPPHAKFVFNRLPDKISKKIIRRTRVLGFLGILAYMTFLIVQDQDIPEQFVYLLETIFIIVISINLISIVWAVNQLPKMLYKYRRLRSVASIIMVLTFISILLAEILGFHNLAFHMLSGILLSMVLFVATWFVHKVLVGMFDSLEDETHSWQQKLHYYLGLKKNETFSEIIWIRILSYLFVWVVFLAILLQIWGLSETDVRLIIDSFYHGFNIGTFTIVPSKIILAVVMFTILILLTRIMRGYFLRHTKIVRDTSSRFALSTILGYIGVVASVVISLLVAGVDFTGIAIIAGALSVGIGFGLQNIVNNFLSGLILLVERPIKIGDRIVVGNTEGYVRQISIRSTRIRTQDRTDVIVPNSELIASQVTNLMFHDKFLRVIVPVGVAYGSDTELVRKVLLEVAEKNENVLQIEGHKAKVLFRSFGDSSLLFELWCVISDANRINDVPSELHFAIDDAFRAHNIEIAFPQQDIYIKSIPKSIDS